LVPQVRRGFSHTREPWPRTDFQLISLTVNFNVRIGPLHIHTDESDVLLWAELKTKAGQLCRCSSLHQWHSKGWASQRASFDIFTLAPIHTFLSNIMAVFNLQRSDDILLYSLTNMIPLVLLLYTVHCFVQYMHLRQFKGPPTVGFSKLWLLHCMRSGAMHTKFQVVNQTYGMNAISFLADWDSTSASRLAKRSSLTLIRQDCSDRSPVSPDLWCGIYQTHERPTQLVSPVRLVQRCALCAERGHSPDHDGWCHA
jgi:hypothetical protein